MKALKYIALIAAMMSTVGIQAQEMKIDTDGGTPAASAMLDVESTTKGMLVPRMTNTQMNAISSPATGLLIFNTTNGAFFFYNGSGWVDLSEDNLGDHVATQNLELNSNYISNDGDNEGITVSNSGAVSTSSTLSVSDDATFGADAYVTSGYVGIGTNAPTSELTIFGDTSSAFTLKSSDNSKDHGIAFQNSGNAYTWSIRRTDAGSNDADLVFSGGDAQSDISNLDERLRINKDGEIGIGTNNPTSLLHLYGAPPANANSGQIQIGESTSGNTMMLGRNQNYGFVQTQNSENLVLNPLGNNVGIGTTSPHNLLHINSSGSSSWTQYTNTSTGSGSTDGFRVGNSGVNAYFQNYESGNMYFRTNNTDRMMILNTGNVGIGENSPSGLLHISDAGDAEFWLEGDDDNSTETDNPMMRFRQDGNTVGMNVGFDETNFGSNNFAISRRYSGTDQNPSIIVEAQTGDVGINNTNPSVELDVGGDVEVTGKTTTSTFKLTTGGSSNKVLVSDADGDASWSDIPAQTHSIILPIHTFSDASLSGGTTLEAYSWDYQYVKFPGSGNFEDFEFSVVLPTDFSSNTFKIRVLYTSNVTSGNFKMLVGFKALASGETVNANPTGYNKTISAPSTANAIGEFTQNYTVGASDRYLFIIIRREGGDSADTSTGEFRVLGVSLDYSN